MEVHETAVERVHLILLLRTEPSWRGKDFVSLRKCSLLH